MTRTLIIALIAAVLAGCASSPPPIVIDGEFNDWTDDTAVTTDPTGDAAPGSFADFRSIRATADSEYVHLLIDFGRPVNIQRLLGHANILLDADGDPATGAALHNMPGVDIAITLTAPNARRPGQRGMGVGVESTTWSPPPDQAHAPSGMISPYDIGFTFGPTYQSQTVEFRINRGAQLPNTPALFTSDRFTAAIVAFDESRNVIDTTGHVTCKLPPLVHHPQPLVEDPPRRAASQSPTSTDNPFTRTPKAAVRIVSWNVEYSSLVRDPDNFIPVLRALEPDVLLLQEITEQTTPNQIADLLNARIGSPDNIWSVLIGVGGGNLRSAIATHLPMQTVDSLQRLEYADRPDRTIRHQSALIDINGRSLLATSIHLRCCGDADSYEEDIRLMEVDVLGSALRQYKQSTSLHGMVIAGDFNLVGGRAPLDNLARNLDRNGASLAVAGPLQLDGRTNATWADTDQPFVPGRLDFLLYSGSSLRPVRTFVLDAADLSPALLQQYDLDAGITGRASDHLPVMADFTWIDQNNTPADN